MDIEHGKLVGYQIRDYRGLVIGTHDTEEAANKAAMRLSGGGSYPASVCRVEAVVELARFFGGLMESAPYINPETGEDVQCEE